MICDVENPAEAVYLDGKRLDLQITVMADDERGLVEQLVIEQQPDGKTTFARDCMGFPKLVVRRGDVRIIMAPPPPRRH